MQKKDNRTQIPNKAFLALSLHIPRPSRLLWSPRNVNDYGGVEIHLDQFIPPHSLVYLFLPFCQNHALRRRQQETRTVETDVLRDFHVQPLPFGGCEQFHGRFFEERHCCNKRDNSCKCSRPSGIKSSGNDQVRENSVKFGGRKCEWNGTLQRCQRNAGFNELVTEVLRILIPSWRK